MSRIRKDTGAIMTYANPYLDAFSALHLPGQSDAREALTTQFAFAIPNEDALTVIINHARNGLVEIGAGTGHWAALLAARGTNVVAYDDNSWGNEHTWFPVERQDWSVVSKHADRTLFLCWPPYDNPMAYDTARAYHAAGGHTIIYIGEGEYGCTGDDRFHHWLRDTCEIVTDVTIPQWPGVHDFLTVYRINGAGAPPKGGPLP